MHTYVYVICGVQLTMAHTSPLRKSSYYDAIARRRAGGAQLSQHRLPLGRTDHRGWLALPRGTPVNVLAILVR